MRRFPISWLLVGAASMYLLDPDRGRRRRHRLEDRARAALGDIEDVAGKAERDIQNRVRGLKARAGGSQSTRHGRTFLNQNLPERRLFDGGAGVLLGVWGLARGGLLGMAAGVGGAYLISRAAVSRKDGIIAIQKTLTIQAPVERVFRYWSRFDNFPQFMEHVLEVSTDGERSHWRVSGPAGIPVEWDAEVTERIDNRKIAWRSLDDSAVQHHGEVHFEPVDEHTTRISIHMAYNPPGGALGHAVAGFLLGDPKTLMDEDLLRFKSLLEHGSTRAHSRQIHADELH